jgi:hypothetical protein
MGYEYTNKHNVSLALAVFLMYDKYDYDDRPNSISATSLIKPMRQIVLGQQNKTLLKTVDIADLVPSRMGSAIHDGCEEAWKDTDNVAKALRALGASDYSISQVRINPKIVLPDTLPVYIEQRTEKEIEGMIVSGKFDLVLDGTLGDYKSTSVWGYIFDSNAENYTKQGSIYKWLNPEKITSDYININYIFTDWSSTKARQDPKRYPQQRVITRKYPLWSIPETEHWILNRLAMYQGLAKATQDELPECTKEELWSSETQYKYYKNPSAKSRSTKNFTNMDDAISRKHADGDIGVIDTIEGEVKACRYCPVVAICDQAEKLLVSGRLTL